MNDIADKLILETYMYDYQMKYSPEFKASMMLLYGDGSPSEKDVIKIISALCHTITLLSTHQPNIDKEFLDKLSNVAAERGIT